MDPSGTSQPSKIQQGSLCCMKSFFQQLAQDKQVEGFSLVTDNALLPRYDVKRHSAPPVMNKATRKMLSNDEAPSCPVRRSSSRDFSEYSSSLFLETIFDEVLDTVFDDVDSINLYDDDDEDQSIDSQDCKACPMHEDLDFDSSFQRFSVDPSGDESLESSTRSSASQREQLVAPRLPVRRDSLERICSSGTSTRLSSGSISVASVATGSSSEEDSHGYLLGRTPPAESSGVHFMHHCRKVGPLQCPVSAPTTRYLMDMGDMNDIFGLPLAEASKYGRRRMRRSSRRSSLDTGLTFRNSFSSQNTDEGIPVM